MVNVDFLNISNATLIGRLLPFWARGRKTSLFLQAILAPIASAHATFKAWALERFIECHITAQRASLEWYLKYKLKQHFLDEGDTFYIADGIDRTVCCFSNNIWTNELPWDNQMRWSANVEPIVDINSSYSCINTGKWRNERLWQEHLYWFNEPEGEEEEEESYYQLMDGIIVFAPAIVNTINYDVEDYERDIRYIMSKYMVSFKKINIVIAKINKS